MIKKYYQSLLSVRYSFLLVTPALIIFFLAFRYTSAQDPKLRTGIYIATAVLLVVMFFYYSGKYRISSGLKKIRNPEEYEKGGMLGNCYLLEDRILTISKKFEIREYKTDGITEMSVQKERNGKAVITCRGTEDFSFEADSLKQAQHFAAYLKRKNPDTALQDIQPAGTGLLKEFGAEYVYGKERNG